MKNLTIDPERLWYDLMQTAKIGGTAGAATLLLEKARPEDLLRAVADHVRSWLFAAKEEGAA